MLKPRIAVLVSGGGTNLAALIKAQKNGVLKSGEIALVISSKPGVGAIERAKEANIPFAVADRTQYPSSEAFEAEILHLLLQNRINLIILAGFMQILSAGFVAHYHDRIINVHPSLIPAYCGKGFYGKKVHEAVLAAGERTTGATVHIVNEIPDGGQILMQKTVVVLPSDTPETLQKRVMEEAEWQLLPTAAEYVCAKLWRTLNQGEEL
ncbi:MAG TPA: phosphoribosylglycinamide formyltransferase [Clostridia bacterium]|nr:phosphoribosylglycinamide formyltransferase [Clostridia bacterium]